VQVRIADRRQAGPDVRIGVVNLRRIGPHAGIDLAADREHAAIAERRTAWVPPGDAHVGAGAPDARPRIEQVDVADADLSARMTSDRQDPAVGKLRVSGAEQS
jgi:hypothetical protein